MNSNNLFKYLNCTDYLRKNLDQFKEVFIKFYGEDKRTKIEESFSKCLYLAFINPMSIDTIINDMCCTQAKTIIDQCISESSLDLSFSDIFPLGYKFEDVNYLRFFNSFYNDYKLGVNGRKDKYIDEKYPVIMHLFPSLTKDEFRDSIYNGTIPSSIKFNLPAYQKIIDSKTVNSNYKDNLDACKELFNNFGINITTNSEYDPNIGKVLDDVVKLFNNIIDKKKDYMKFESSLSSYRQISNSSRNLRRNISNRYFRLFVQRNFDIIPKEFSNSASKFLCRRIEYKDTDNIIRFLFGDNLDSPSDYEYFSSSNNDKLENGELWEIDRIKYCRMKYFKLLGYDLGNNYMDYVNNDEIKELWPDSSRVDSFINWREKYMNSRNVEYFESIPYNINFRREIAEQEHYFEDVDFNAGIYNQAAFISPNVTYNDGEFNMSSLLVLNCRYGNLYLDHMLVHELNHLYELSLTNYDTKQCEFLCGWDRYTLTDSNAEKEVDTLHYDTSKREYELLNEVVNETIAGEISELMEEEGIHIFNEPDKSLIYDNTYYEQFNFLVSDFYNTYKNDIISSRSDGNIDVIFESVGKDNFDQLSDLVNSFHGHLINGFDSRDLRFDLANDFDTDEVKIYNDLCSKRDIILNNMKEYHNEKSSNKK